MPPEERKQVGLHLAVDQSRVELEIVDPFIYMN